MTTETVDLLWEAAFTEGRSSDPVRAAYADLTGDDALVLAEQAVTLLERTSLSPAPKEGVWRNKAFDLLDRLACLIPGVLSVHHDRLLDQDVLRHGRGVVFCGASPSVRDGLIESAEGLTETAERGDVLSLLGALAWIDDEVVRSAFHRWAREAPGWATACGASVVSPQPVVSDDPAAWIWWMSTDAGWTLGRDQARRSLYRPPCRRLSDFGNSLAASVGGAFQDQLCPWCSSPLTVLLDLDLGHPDLAFLEISGRRLRIPVCERCVCATTIYLDVDMNGSARWSEVTESPGRIEETASEDDLIPAGARALGQPRRSPFGAMVDYFYDDVSQVGGVPTWVQDDEYPPCPQCGELMPFLGQVDTSVVAWGEGVIYMFIDVHCRTAAALYQQT